jgi:hypothetical protein
MALQASGAISLADIQTEFGGDNPISLSEYNNGAAGTLITGSNTDTDNGQTSVNTYAKVIAAGTRVCDIVTNNLSGTFRATIKAYNSSSLSTDDGFVAIGHYRTGGFS